MVDQQVARGRYYEEFNEGERIRSAGRTVTESDVYAFAALSGDYNQLHTDREYARESVYGERIAHGILILSIVSGLAARMGFSEGTALALTKIQWKLKEPVFMGDTIYAVFEVKRKKKVSRMGGGFVSFGVSVINQDDKIVQKGNWTIMMKSKDTKQR